VKTVKKKEKKKRRRRREEQIGFHPFGKVEGMISFAYGVHA
jgi:hypothetical protein